MLGIVTPVFVLQNLFAHKQHRYAGRRQEYRRRKARAAACIPGVWIRRVRQPRDARFELLRIAIGIDDVVVLDAIDRTPSIAKTVRCVERLADWIEIYEGVATDARLIDGRSK